MSSLEIGLHEDIPADVYHAGLANPRPLSSTLAKNLLRKLPEEARFELEQGEHKESYDLGTAAHELILQGGFQAVAELPFDSFRSKDAQAARDEARNDGLTPLLSKQLEAVKAMADAVRSKTDNKALLESGGMAEVSALVEYEGIPLQTRYDYLQLPRDGKGGFVLDLKTVAGSADQREFLRNAATYGYHIQASMYQKVLELLGYGRLPFIWLVVSKKEPYASNLIQAQADDLEIGAGMFEIAVKKWANIIENGWPTTTGIRQAGMPKWIEYEAEELDNE